MEHLLQNQTLAKTILGAMPESEALPNMEMSRLYAELSKLPWSKTVEDAFADAAIYCMKDATEASSDERDIILKSVA